MLKRTVYITLVLLIALTVRLYTAFTTTELPQDDALAYDRLAIDLLSGKGYVGEDDLPTSLRPPAYSFVLSVIYFIFGHSYLAVRIFQAFLGTLTVFLFYLIGRDIHSETTGVMAAFFAAAYPSYIILTKLLFSETLFTFLLALSVYLFLKMRKALFASTAVLLGITLGILSLTRSSALLLPFIYTTLLLLLVPRDKIKRALYFAGLVLLFYVITLSPWIYRNNVIHARPVLISTNGGLNFYQSVTPVRGKIFGLIPSDKTIEESKQITNEAEKDKFLFKKAIERIAENPMRTCKLAFMRSLFYWGFFDWEVQKGTEYNYMYAFILPFFMLGFALGLKDIRGFGMIQAIIVYFSLLILVSQGAVRYRLPTDGFLFILGSFGISSILERAKHKIAVLSGIAVYFVLNYIIFLSSESCKLFLKGFMERVGLW